MSLSSRIELSCRCPKCGEPVHACWNGDQQAVTCAACGQAVTLRADALENNRLTRCPLCSTDEMYVHKDFPHGWGMLIVVVGCLLSTVAWWQYHYPLALAILFVFVAVDLVLYWLVGEVTVCYGCEAHYRGVSRNADHQPFDLAVGEKYRQQRIRALLRRTDGS